MEYYIRSGIENYARFKLRKLGFKGRFTDTKSYVVKKLYFLSVTKCVASLNANLSVAAN